MDVSVLVAHEVELVHRKGHRLGPDPQKTAHDDDDFDHLDHHNDHD